MYMKSRRFECYIALLLPGMLVVVMASAPQLWLRELAGSH